MSSTYDESLRQSSPGVWQVNLNRLAENAIDLRFKFLPHVTYYWIAGHRWFDQVTGIQDSNDSLPLSFEFDGAFAVTSSIFVLLYSLI